MTFKGPYKLKAGEAPMAGYVVKAISYRMAYPKKTKPVKPPLGTAHKAKAASVAPVKKKAPIAYTKKMSKNVTVRKRKAPLNAHPWDEYGP